MKNTIERMNQYIEEARDLLKRAEMLARYEEKKQVLTMIEDAMAKLSLVQAYIDHMDYAGLNEEAYAKVQQMSVAHDNLLVKAEMVNETIRRRG